MFFLMSRTVTPEESKNIIDRKIKDARDVNKTISFEKLNSFEKNYLSEISEKEKIQVVEEKIKNPLIEVIFQQSLPLAIGLFFTYGIAKSMIANDPKLAVILLDPKMIGLFATTMIVTLVMKIVNSRNTTRYNVKFLDS